MLETANGNTSIRSYKTAKLSLTIKFWRSLIKKHEDHNISSLYLRRTVHLCDFQNYKVITLEECICAKRKAFKEYKVRLKVADHPSFIEDLADAIAVDNDLGTVVRQLKSQEESRHTYKEIRNSTRYFSGAPYHMELPNATGSYMSTDKEEIEKALISEYEGKYRLGEAPPFLKDLLISEFGQLALNDKSDRDLDNSYI